MPPHLRLVGIEPGVDAPDNWLVYCEHNPTSEDDIGYTSQYLAKVCLGDRGLKDLIGWFCNEEDFEPGQALDVAAELLGLLPPHE